MGAYEFNKATYKAVTIRLNRMNDADVIKHLKGVKSVNQYIIELIRKDAAVSNKEALYEVIEDTGTRKDVLKGFKRLDAAVSFLYEYVSLFTPLGRVYIVQRFTGILTDGHKVKCGKELDIVNTEKVRKN